jgi:hypothetical protein
MSLLASTLIVPSARGLADDDDRRDLRNQRQDLHQDQRQLERLEQQRNHEIREGDRGEAREYNDKIHETKRDIRKDRRNLKNRDREHHDHD